MPEVKLKECYRFKARISAVRDFKRGSYLLLRTYRLPHDSRVAVIPVGLVDGFGVEAIPKPSGVIDFLKMGIKLLASFLNLNRTALTATINGKPAYIRGKMFMQFCLVEIPSRWVEPGDVVELPVKRTLASLAVPRFYLREGGAEPMIMMCYRCRSRALSNNQTSIWLRSNYFTAREGN